MNIPRQKYHLVALTVIVIGLALFVLVNFTEVAQLRAVTFDGEIIENFEEDLGLQAQKSLLHQPLDSLSQVLLKRKDVARVDIDYRLFDELAITTNRFDPACFAIDQKSGKLVGLTEQGRVVPVSPQQSDWELPVLVSVSSGKLYQFCSDNRVSLVVTQLQQLRRENSDLFRLISEIDLAQPGYLLISIAGLPYRLKATTERLRFQLLEFIEFIEKYQPDLERTTELDLRFDDMIIRVEKAS